MGGKQLARSGVRKGVIASDVGAGPRRSLPDRARGGVGGMAQAREQS